MNNDENENLEELHRFAARLEEQASNFQVSTDNIDYDFRCIYSVITESKDEAHQELANTAIKFADGWYSTRNNLKYCIIELSARILEFYDETMKNVTSSSSKLEALKQAFDNYYATNNIERENKGMYWTQDNQTGWSKSRPNYTSNNGTN